jgi:drug/metabolite transporter (DMT)-like permease
VWFPYKHPLLPYSQKVSPVFTLLIAFFFLKEKITPIGFFGVVFIVMGVVMLAFNKPGAEPFLP